MPQRQQVHPHDNLEVGLERERGRGLDQPVHPEPRKEAHVVGDEDMIETAFRRSAQQPATMIDFARQHSRIREGSNGQL
jgi:hypothetical protein